MLFGKFNFSSTFQRKPDVTPKKKVVARELSNVLTPYLACQPTPIESYGQNGAKNRKKR